MMSAICLAAERSLAVSGLPSFERKHPLAPATRCHFGVMNRAVLLVEVATGLRTGEPAALDLALQVVERKAGIPEEDDTEGEPAEEDDQRVEDRRRHHP